jgi:HD-GYP domain-containing protein (c-di-GMP phosphodiesterase class II)
VSSAERAGANDSTMALPRRSGGDSVDPYVIRYLDGSTTSSPILPQPVDRPQLRLVERESIQTGRLLAALSTALDLTEGQLSGHSLRTCYLAMCLADTLGLPEADRQTLFFSAFLKDAGCSSNAAAVTRIFGVDDIALKGRQATLDRSLIAYAAFTIRNLPSSEPLPLRLRRLIRIGLGGRTAQRAVEQIRCERGASIARKAGFGEPVATTIHDVHEHWDGGGNPRGLRGQAIDPLARIIGACQGLDVFVSTRGRTEALRVLAERRGTWYDPEISDALLDMATDGLLDDLAAPGLLGRAMAFEPNGVIRLSDDAAIDRIAGAFAEIVDAKSPYTGFHSQHVAELAEGVAVRMGLPAADVIDVRRAGLLHDLGKLGVPNMILDKPARLTPEEFEIIKRHPELTLRILSQIPTFSSVAELAACHHERLDGRGYFRGLTAPSIALGARIVAVADVWEALSADRPYRAALPTDVALAIIREETGDHLAADAVEALAQLVV